MGNKMSIRKVGFEDIQFVIKHKKRNYILINTLTITEQNCLIPGTIAIKDEEAIINKHLNNKRNIYINKNCHYNSFMLHFCVSICSVECVML